MSLITNMTPAQRAEFLAAGDTSGLLTKDQATAGTGVNASGLVGSAAAQVNGLTGKSRVLKPRKILLHSDSTGVGQAAGYPSSSAYASRTNATRKLRDVLRAAGYQAQDNFFSPKGWTSASSYSVFDPSVVFDAGWDYTAQVCVNLGMWRNTTTTGALTITPDDECDSVVIYTKSSGASGQISVTYAGVTKTLTVNSTLGLRSLAFGPGDGIVPTKGAVVISRVSGTCDIGAVHMFNSRLPALQIINASAGGARMDHVTRDEISGNGQSLNFPEAILVPGDEAWLAIGPNDWRTSNQATGAIDTFRTNTQRWMDKRIAGGIAARAFLPPRTATTDATVANMDAFSDVVRQEAIARGIPVVAIKDRWGEYVDANAAGFMASGDPFHPSWFGAADLGQLYGSIALGYST